MKAGNLLAVIAVWGVLIFFASGTAGATPGARIMYQEMEAGNGLWQYDYTFANTSDAGEYLFSVWFDFDREAEVTGLSLPGGWMGATIWEGTHVTTYLDPVSTEYSYDIAAGNSLAGFRFVLDYQAGSIQYTAYFDDRSGNVSPVFGTSAATVVPEPVSTMLFISGGAVLAARLLMKRKQMKFFRANY